MPTGKKKLHMILLSLTILTLLNLLLTASLVGLIGGIVILIMVWGIRRGDYPLARALAVFLFLYAGINLVVLALTLIAGAAARISALVWLFGYSAVLIVLGILLCSKPVRTYLKTAQPPEEKPKKIHFFHGGWRDL